VTTAAGRRPAWRTGADKSKPQVAVIVPARNEEARLGTCLASVREALSKANLSAELVVVDDDSTDSTAEVARSAGVAILRQHPRGGTLAAWLAGVRGTDAPWLIFVDADCWVEPGAFQGLTREFDRTDVGVLAARSMPAGTAVPANLIDRSARFSSLLLHETKMRLGSHEFLPIGRLMAVRRAAWNVEYTRGVPCDSHVTGAAMSAGWNVKYVPDAIVRYELVHDYATLRADYYRTRVAPPRLTQGYERLPRATLARAAGAAAVEYPAGAMAWTACRVALWTERLSGRMRRGGAEAYERWNISPPSVR
jgi:glycosyltransferase involved in cell wall biosynthesis